MEFLLKETTPADIGFRGQWRPVLYTPNLSSPQDYVIGCVVEYGSRIRAFKILSDLRKLDCIYGKGTGTQFLSPMLGWLTQALSTALAAETETPMLELVSPQLRLGEWRATKGETPELTANRIFDTIVALRPTTEEPPARFETMTTDALRTNVNALLKNRLHFDFERIVDERGFIEHDGHHLCINIMSPNCLGSVVSACYASAESVETQLLRQANDIDTARDLYRIDRARLFVFKPDDAELQRRKLSTDTIKAINNHIDHLDWSATSRHWQVSVRDSAEAIADEVVEFV